jgi:hypothetical protein
LSPWLTPAQIWLEKVGLAEARAGSGPMRAGIVLEGAIIDLTAAIVGERITRNARRVAHPRWPEVPLYATPDGYTRRRWQTVEVKLVGYRGADWSGGPPAYVETQVQAQLACHPKAVAGIVGALLGSDVRTWTIPRDEEVIAAIEADVAGWWSGYVLGEVAPPAVDDDDRWAVLRALKARDPAGVPRVAVDEEEVLGARLVAALATEDALKAEVAELRLAVAEAAAGDTLAGQGWKAGWSDRRQTDWAAIVRDEKVPRRVMDRYTTTQRVFTFRRSRAAVDDTEETA